MLILDAIAMPRAKPKPILRRKRRFVGIDWRLIFAGAGENSSSSAVHSVVSSLLSLYSKIATANHRARKENALTNKSTVKKWDCWICMTVNAENSEARSPTERPYRRETSR